MLLVKSPVFSWVYIPFFVFVVVVAAAVVAVVVAVVAAAVAAAVVAAAGTRVDLVVLVVASAVVAAAVAAAAVAVVVPAGVVVAGVVVVSNRACFFWQIPIVVSWVLSQLHWSQCSIIKSPAEGLLKSVDLVFFKYSKVTSGKLTVCYGKSPFFYG